ncbi:MAG: SMC-Scp complex subunit ScpB [Phycisphaerae bacterium]|nr:SMC-Scp complex subunit ScpB [Phycisphaerae bacterium]
MSDTATVPGKSRRPAPEPIAPEKLAGAVEAVLLSIDRPMSLGKIAQALGLESDPAAATSVRNAIESLNKAYDESNRAFRIEQVAGGFRAMARPEFGGVLASLHGLKEQQSLSRAALETLAIIAYRQPITRADLEAIRGVACGEVLRSILEKRLIDIVGRAEELGRPMLYGTTRRFLESFGLASIKDLPNHQDFAPPVTAHIEKKPAQKTTEEGATS